MITQPTVLILGAGASMHLDYPSGSDLKDEIVKKLTRNSSMYNELYKFILDVRPLDELRDGLKFSGSESIDQFLEHRPELIEAGKLAIAYTLIPYENKNRLFETNGNWYSHLFKNLNTSFDTFAKNKLTIITFNYDRSLEQYLFIALKNTYGKTDVEVAEVINNLNFIHVYGQLCPLPWQNKSNSRQYDSKLNDVFIKLSAEQIKIIHDNIEDSYEFTIAKESLAMAKKICFLGFGYHEINMKRLGMNYIELKTKPIGSSYGDRKSVV